MARRPVPGTPEGIVLIDKPPGWTSHDVVARARKLTGQRRIGHTGTLDPAATGLLVLCLGRATRLVEYMTAHDKCYEGAITLGVSTDTDDAEGQAVESLPVPELSATRLRELEDAFTGAIQQRPPSYSAISVDGKRAYASARHGELLQLPERAVQVHSIELSASQGDQLSIHVHCGPGTYIRALARDIGIELGCGAHLSSLRRTAAGGFDVSAAVSLDQLAAIAEAERLDKLLLPADEGVRDMPAALLSPHRATLLAQGERLHPLRPGWRAAPAARIYEAAGAFLGIGKVTEKGMIHPLKIFAPPDNSLMSRLDTNPS